MMLPTLLSNLSPPPPPSCKTRRQFTNQQQFLITSKTIFLFLFLLMITPINSRIPDEPAIPNNMITPLIITTTPSSSLVPQQQEQEFNNNNHHHHQQQQQQGACFYAEPELCNETVNLTLCECYEHPTIQKSLVCCNVKDIDKSLSCAPILNSTHWVNVHIRNATLDELDVSNKFWKRLDSMIITDGSIKRISKEFTKFSSTKCFNISNNNLTDIHPRALKNLMHLQMLDMSENNLTSMPKINSILTNLTFNIRGNNAMLCKTVLEYIERGFKFDEPDTTFCLSNKTFYWFNSTESLKLSQLERMKQLQTECPPNCKCEAERMNYVTFLGIKHLVFTAKVDCSGLGLTELPEKLPANTFTLNVSHNNISNLKALNDNDDYKQILRLYADNNQISSMLELEGTKFIEEFEALYLRWNKLKSIPTYIFNLYFDRNPSGRQVYLEGNKLYCDCNSAKVLRLWLLARQTNIIDFEKILCENIPQKVIDLSELKLCQSQHDWTDYINYLIAMEIILLLALILKVSYDYWIFKTAGYLPFPASKMPKLPCDFFCES